MDGMLPKNQNLMDAVNARIAEFMQQNQQMSDIPLKGNPEMMTSSVAAKDKPHTQKKIPKQMMSKVLKERIYELSPDSDLSLQDINDIDTAVYRSR